ncbi:MAG: DUF2066 domain-containing protein [Pseudomonadota bacterium]
MSKNLIIILLALCTLCVKTSQAAPVKQLFQASVAIADTSMGSRVQAIQSAFAATLIKVTGNPNVVNIPNIQNAISNAESYLEQYGYQNDNGQSYLMASFYPNLIKNLLKQNNVALWGSDRPEVLVWLVSKQNQIMSSTTASPLQQALLRDASNRGLPISLPLMDMHDLQSITAKQLCAFDQQAIQAASNRYHPDVILVACLQPDNNPVNSAGNSNWQGHFSLFTRNQTYSWTSQQIDEKALLADSIAKVGNDLAQNYAVNTDQDNVTVVKLVVSNIRDYQVLNQVRKYLAQLTPVQQVAVNSIAPNVASFSLEVIGGSDALIHVLNLDHELVPAKQINQNNDNGLYYQWLS